MSESELFSIYGFRTVYPSTWKIELDPKSDRNKGNVAFRSPDKTNILVSWGTLEEAKKKYASPEKFAMEALNRIKESREIKTVEVVQNKPEKINSHEANFTHIKMIKSNPGLLQFSKARAKELEIRSMHFYCDDSKRYFVIYGMIEADKSAEQKEVFESIVKSFKCHERFKFLQENKNFPC